MHPLPALKGWRVAELADSIAARMCGRMLAACGAQVERKRAKETLEGAFSTWLDQNKKIVRTPDLVEADIVIAGPSAADIRRAEQAIAIAGSHATVLALPWFDLNGPYAKHAINDALMQAITAVAYSFGKAEGPPVLPQGHAPQLVAGVVAYIAAVSGMLLKQRPRRIDTNVFEAALCFSEPGIVGAVGSGLGSRRLGVNRFSPTYPCSIYRASDDWVGLTALTPAQWRALCNFIGRPELGREPRFAATLQRLRAADEIDALLEPLFAQRTAQEWIDAGIEHRIPITPVPRPGGAPKLAHWKTRRSFTPIASGHAVEGPALPYKMDFDGRRQKRHAGAKPLEGVRVVDFSMGWAGPLAARYFADLGADVVKIESESHPDWWRSWEGRLSDDPTLLERARNFLDVNRGKRGTLLDLATPEGLAAAKALIARADIVIENLGPGVMTRLGLGPTDLRALRPGIISISMGAFGSYGPLAGVRAYGSTVEQASGMPFVNGHEDWAPCLQHVAYGDPVAGLFAAAAGLTAIAGRETCGGAVIDLAQVECLFQLCADAIVTEQARGAPLERNGSRRAVCAPCCVVSTSEEEGFVAIAVDTDAQWRKLCTLLEREAWSDHGCAERNAIAEDIEAALGKWAAPLTAAQAVAELRRAGIPAARLLRTSDLVEDAHLVATDFWLEMDRAITGPHFTGATPFRFDGVRPMRATPAPTMGQHTDEVLAELGHAPARV